MEVFGDGTDTPELQKTVEEILYEKSFSILDCIVDIQLLKTENECNLFIFSISEYGEKGFVKFPVVALQNLNSSLNLASKMYFDSFFAPPKQKNHDPKKFHEFTISGFNTAEYHYLFEIRIKDSFYLKIIQKNIEGTNIALINGQMIFAIMDVITKLTIKHGGKPKFKNKYGVSPLNITNIAEKNSENTIPASEEYETDNIETIITEDPDFCDTVICKTDKIYQDFNFKYTLKKLEEFDDSCINSVDDLSRFIVFLENLRNELQILYEDTKCKLEWIQKLNSNISENSENKFSLKFFQKDSSQIR